MIGAEDLVPLKIGLFRLRLIGWNAEVMILHDCRISIDDLLLPWEQPNGRGSLAADGRYTNLLHLHGFVNSERLNCPADLLASQMSH
jgi:hypothetical protein